MFYKETNFKDTEIGRIPKEWEVARIRDVAKNVIDSPHRMPKRTSKGYPFVSVNYVLQFSDYNFYIDPNREGLEHIPKEEYEEFRKRFDTESGDIIYTKWGTPGVAKLVNTSEKFIGSCSVALIKPKRNMVLPLFLVYSLNSLTVRSQILPYSHTSTRTEIHIGHIKRIKIPLPPLKEQQKIAHVLMSIDKAIEAVNETIAKAERIKKGLMQELLTKGIGHKEFKDTEIGRIPKEWEVVELEKITLPTENIDPTKEHRKEFKYVDISSIDNSANKIIGWNLINSKNAPSRARKLIKAGDIIFATTRPYLKNIAIVPEELDEQICSTGFCVIRPNKDFAITEWIYYNVLMERFVLKVSAKMRGSSYPAVSDDDVLNEKIPLPPTLEEQQRIIEILSKWDEVIELKRKKKEKLERMKKKVMDLLLTGKVRVRV